MKTYEKWSIGLIAFTFIIILGVQIGIYEGRKLTREEMEGKEIDEIIALQQKNNELKKEIELKDKLLQKKKDVFTLTAYCNDPVCINVKQYRDGLTATGEIAKLGIVAVDPSIIPLKSNIYIEGLGWFMAEDVGGKIKGKKIDIFLGDFKKAKEFGKKKMTVYY